MKKIYLTILLFFLLSTNAFAFITFKQSKDISTDTAHLRGVTFKPDGSRMYVTADDIGHTTEFYLSLGYVPIDGTKFAFDLKNNESAKAGFNISKNINGFDLKFDYENYLTKSNKDDHLANLSLHKIY